MELQEAFDKVWDHFVVQGNGPSIDPSIGYPLTSCKYRGPNGAKCAFGVLLPDELYDEGMEGKRATYVLFRYPSLRSHFGISSETEMQLDKDHLVSLLGSMQRVHDGAAQDEECRGEAFRDRLRSGLTRVAERHNLTLPANKE